jgi:DNA replication protein DnaC
MTNTTLMLLRQLKLTGMADALTMQQTQPNNYDNLSFEERLQLLVDAEHLERGQRKQQRLLKAAKLKLHATARDIDYTRHSASNSGINLLV